MIPHDRLLVWRQAEPDSAKKMSMKPNFTQDSFQGLAPRGNFLAAGGCWFQDKTVNPIIHQSRVP